MKWFIATVISGAFGIASSPGSLAVTADGKQAGYQVIVDRNAFGLRPIPPPPKDPKADAPPPSNLELSGISTIFGKRQVFLNIKDHTGKATAKMLTLGEPEDGIEILKVDEIEGLVKVNNRGVETELTFKTHGAKVPSGPAQPGAPGTPGAPVPVFRPPTPIQGVQQPYFQNPAAPNTGPGGMPSGFSDPNAPAAGTAAPRTIPTRSIRTPAIQSDGGSSQVNPLGTGTQQQAKQPPLSVEEQIIMMELSKQLNQGGPPLPPTPLSQ